MSKNKNSFNANNSTVPDITTASSKANPINDGVKNADMQQNSGAKLNMPSGAKKPKNTSK